MRGLRACSLTLNPPRDDAKVNIMRRLTLLIALAATAGLGSCTDATGPGSRGVAGTAQQDWHLSADRTGDGVGDSELRILEHSPSALLLETYKASFKACRNKSQTLQIRYAYAGSNGEGDDDDDGEGDDDDDGEGDDDDESSEASSDLFLELTVPKKSLYRRPNGEPFGKKDCVKITVEVDPTLLVAHFKPAGLVFSGSRPARLRMWYAEANPDLNGDGVVDYDDEQTRDRSLGIWRLPLLDEPWHQIGAVHYRDAYRFEAELYEFSHYAVAH